MKRFVLSAASILLSIIPIGAATYKGYVKDAKTGEELIGATVFIKEYPNIGSTTGLDGSFVIDNVPNADKITIVCSYISYQTMEKVISATTTELINFDLPADTKLLDEVTVIAHNPGRSTRY